MTVELEVRVRCENTKVKAVVDQQPVFWKKK